MLKFNDKGMPVYTDPMAQTYIDMNIGISEAAGKAIKTKSAEVEKAIQAELKEAETTIRNKYRDQYGSSIVGETQAAKDLKALASSVL